MRERERGVWEKKICNLIRMALRANLFRPFPPSHFLKPLFGLLYDHLATTTEALFAQKDFSEKQLLQSLFYRCRT